MNYIVFDLEWNQSPGGKKYSNSRLPFEIIEAATHGDITAINSVLAHFEGYIATLATCTLYDEHGSPCQSRPGAETTAGNEVDRPHPQVQDRIATGGRYVPLSIPAAVLFSCAIR